MTVSEGDRTLGMANLKRKITLKSSLLSAVVVAGLVGCASNQNGVSSDSRTQKASLAVYGLEEGTRIPDSLKGYEKRLRQQGHQGAVLNQMEIGIRAFKMGHYKLATQALDYVLEQIESVYADNENARKARSLWHEEGRKDFKGEPYERSMAYYYRGLLYLREGEYDNARASFLGGLLQDSFAEEQQYRSDFALLMFLAGWSAHLMGDEYLAKEAFDELKKFRPDFKVPGRSQNVLVIAETGFSPRKLADGVGHYELVYRRGKHFKEARAELKLGQKVIELYPMEDVYWQAATRGGRTVDRIIKGKVQFKEGTETAGTALSQAANQAVALSSLFTSSSAVSGAGTALSLIGVSSMILSSKVNARVDTRYCEALPDLVHVATLALSDNPRMVIHYTDQFGNDVALEDDEVTVHRDRFGNGLVWASAR